jgi:hypothetical protein
VDLIINDLSRPTLRLALKMNGVSYKDPESAATRLTGVRASEIAAASLPGTGRFTTIRSDNLPRNDRQFLSTFLAATTS